MKILFLVPYPIGESPSQRFRFEQYFSFLKQNNHQVIVQSFLNSHNWQLFFKVGSNFSKAIALAAGFFRRFVMLFDIPRYDFIFIHREAAPLGPPFFEWIIAKIFNGKIIYDFDDAIWQTDRQDESLFLKISKWRGKVRMICKWSYKVSCGNEYLCSYASRYNKHVINNPTTIDTENLHNPDLFNQTQNKAFINIGWTGSHSTLKYLDDIEDVLQKIESDFPNVRIIIIADKKPNLNLKSLSFVPWSLISEIEDLLILDIGLMPLPDDEWAKGKCGFKILQYLALKIPAIASPVGVNTQLIEDGKSGFLCPSKDSWYNAIKILITENELRNSFGINGREFVKKNYSVISNKSIFLSLFE